MQSRTLLQALIFALLVAGLAYAVISNADNWADWVVLGVIALTAVGAAIALYPRRYPTKKRTFIRHSGPEQR
jgi:hypothetical protein